MLKAMLNMGTVQVEKDEASQSASFFVAQAVKLHPTSLGSLQEDHDINRCWHCKRSWVESREIEVLSWLTIAVTIQTRYQRE